MRLLPALCLLPLLALSAHAQPLPAPQGAPDSAAAASATPAAAAAAPTAAPRHRLSWQQRFAEANTTHDGHLTLDQAKAGYRSIVRHFSDIDVAKKGYVTVDDIAAWHKLQRAMRHSNHDPNEQSLRPRPAMQHGMPALHGLTAATDAKLAPMNPPAAPHASGDASVAQPGHGT